MVAALSGAAVVASPAEVKPAGCRRDRASTAQDSGDSTGLPVPEPSRGLNASIRWRIADIRALAAAAGGGAAGANPRPAATAWMAGVAGVNAAAPAAATTPDCRGGRTTNWGVTAVGATTAGVEKIGAETEFAEGAVGAAESLRRFGAGTAVRSWAPTGSLATRAPDTRVVGCAARAEGWRDTVAPPRVVDGSLEGAVEVVPGAVPSGSAAAMTGLPNTPPIPSTAARTPTRPTAHAESDSVPRMWSTRMRAMAPNSLSPNEIRTIWRPVRIWVIEVTGGIRLRPKPLLCCCLHSGRFAHASDVMHCPMSLRARTHPGGVAVVGRLDLPRIVEWSVVEHRVRPVSRLRGAQTGSTG